MGRCKSSPGDQHLGHAHLWPEGPYVNRPGTTKGDQNKSTGVISFFNGQLSHQVSHMAVDDFKYTLSCLGKRHAKRIGNSRPDGFLSQVLAQLHSAAKEIVR